MAFRRVVEEGGGIMELFTETSCNEKSTVVCDGDFNDMLSSDEKIGVDLEQLCSLMALWKP